MYNNFSLQIVDLQQLNTPQMKHYHHFNINDSSRKQYELKQNNSLQIKTQISGLPNIGNTCFLATAIQILYSSMSFRRYLWQSKFDSSLRWSNILKKLLIQLFRNDKSQKYLLMKQILDLLQKNNSQYKMYHQEDCMFYLNRIIQSLLKQNSDLKTIFYFSYFRICQNQMNHQKDDLNLDLIQNQVYLVNNYEKCGNCMMFDIKLNSKIIYVMSQKPQNILIGNGVKLQCLYFLKMPKYFANKIQKHYFNQHQEDMFDQLIVNQKSQEKYQENQQKLLIFQYKLKGYVNYFGNGRSGHYTATRKRLQSYKQQSKQFYVYNDSQIYKKVNENSQFFQSQYKKVNIQQNSTGFVSLYELEDELTEQKFNKMYKYYCNQKNNNQNSEMKVISKNQYFQILGIINELKTYQKYIDKQLEIFQNTKQPRQQQKKIKQSNFINKQTQLCRIKLIQQRERYIIQQRQKVIVSKNKIQRQNQDSQNNYKQNINSLFCCKSGMDVLQNQKQLQTMNKMPRVRNLGSSHNQKDIIKFENIQNSDTFHQCSKDMKVYNDKINKNKMSPVQQQRVNIKQTGNSTKISQYPLKQPILQNKISQQTFFQFFKRMMTCSCKDYSDQRKSAFKNPTNKIKPSHQNTIQKNKKQASQQQVSYTHSMTQREKQRKRQRQQRKKQHQKRQQKQQQSNINTHMMTKRKNSSFFCELI